MFSAPSHVGCADEHLLGGCDRNFEEFYHRSEISELLLFYQKYPFGELFSKMTFKSSTTFSFF